MLGLTLPFVSWRSGLPAGVQGAKEEPINPVPWLEWSRRPLPSARTGAGFTVWIYSLFELSQNACHFQSRIWLDWAKMTLTLELIAKKGGEDGMKQALSKEALAQEAAFWGNVKKLLMNPGTVCHS
jgi:hypothetical protein